MLFCEVRCLIRVVITSFYCSKLRGFLKADRLAGVILPVMSIVTAVGGELCLRVDYCLVTAAGLLLQQTLGDLRLITARLTWLNIDLCLMCSAAWHAAGKPQHCIRVSCMHICKIEVFKINLFQSFISLTDVEDILHHYITFVQEFRCPCLCMLC